jgi:hypothetical protein
MRRALAWIGGGLGLLALLRRRRRPAVAPEPALDPAAELRAKLDEARAVDDDRDEFDAAEGQPLEEAEPPRSIEERRRAIHEQAQQALDEMRRPPDE